MSQATTVALITGANKGIGFEIARQLGEQGIIVLVGARDLTRGRAAASQLQAQSINAQAIQIDVTDQATIDAAAASIDKTYGKLDILVNNAGTAVMSEFSMPPSQVDVKTLKDIYETNVFGAFAVTKTMLPLILRSEAGRIVNQSSALGSLGLNVDPTSYASQFPPVVGYNSSKTALNALTVLFARELQNTSVKINSVSPGPCATDLSGNMGQPAAVGAQIAVRLSTIGADGPTGGFFEADVANPW
jgi:NAD(P)-dependent dehydrogenase (short-subunit alcohol dehydrogenase family)